jgi:GNAT superfamily N-acetyltransferase
MKDGFVIQPVSPADLLLITRMVYANMAGADEDFSRLLSNRLSRWAGYFMLPFYLFWAGQGYKALLDGRIIGCAFLDLRERSGCVFNVSVNAAYRRRGVATELMAHLEYVTRSKNRHWMALQVDKNNLPAWKLYERLGYRPYHPYFLRHRQARGLALPAPVAPVAVEPLGRHGRNTFRQLLALERSTGDGWVDRVVAEEYSLTAPAGGVYWRCRYGREDMGCAWTAESGAKAIFFLLLRPPYWGHTATVSLVDLLRQRLATPPKVLDLHFGSSEHHLAATTLLEPLGFQKESESRILMLKQMTQ